ncbi:MAG: GAF domain-containing protein, partial [Chloroflexi bacterium]
AQIAIAVQNARSFASEREERDLSDALRATAAAISSTLKFEDVLEQILRYARRVVPHDASDIMLIDGSMARIVRSSGYADELADSVLRLRFDIDQIPHMQEIIETRQPFIIPDTAQYPGWIVTPESAWIRSHIVAPIEAEGEVIGFLDLDSATPGAFTPDSAARLQAFADQAAAAISNARAYAQVQETEKALEGQFAFLQNLIDNIPNPIFYKGTNGAYLGCNRAFSEYVGIPTQEIIGKTAFDVFPPEQAEIFHQKDIELFREQALQVYDANIPFADGTLRDVVFNRAPFLDTSGEVAGLVGVMLDVTDRNRAEAEIRRRAVELQTVAEVGAQVTTILEVEELLWTVSNLVTERFGLYHAHVYLLDPTGANLVLAAGAGAAGRQMVAAGHRIATSHERSLVARAARDRQSVIVNNVRGVPDFLPNPLLPQTQSELAIPLLAGDQLLGVLDVQGGKQDMFSEDDARVLGTLASQIAVSVQNAQLFSEVQIEAERRAWLYELGQRLSESLEPEAIANSAAT